MAIQFACPNCDYEVQAPDGTTGKTGICPKCKKQATIPEQTLAPDSTTHHDGEADSGESHKKQSEIETGVHTSQA